MRRVEAEELEKIRAQVGEDFFATSRADESQGLFEQVALSGERYIEFLTIPAYDHID